MEEFAGGTSTKDLMNVKKKLMINSDNISKNTDINILDINLLIIEKPVASIYLPEVDKENIRAEMDNGLLKIIAKKILEVKNIKIE